MSIKHTNDNIDNVKSQVSYNIPQIYISTYKVSTNVSALIERGFHQSLTDISLPVIATTSAPSYHTRWTFPSNDSRHGNILINSSSLNPEVLFYQVVFY